MFQLMRIFEHSDRDLDLYLRCIHLKADRCVLQTPKICRVTVSVNMYIMLLMENSHRSRTSLLHCWIQAMTEIGLLAFVHWVGTCWLNVVAGNRTQFVGKYLHSISIYFKLVPASLIWSFNSWLGAFDWRSQFIWTDAEAVRWNLRQLNWQKRRVLLCFQWDLV